MHNPVATYRIQFNKDFTFKDLEHIIPYLHQLGVSTIYASPIFEATPGSTHGYDVVNPLRINPEIGTLKQLENISKILKKFNIGWLQDIVPNHMAFHQNNTWLMDVLENGRRSAYADFFDIIWSAPVYRSRVMVPLLGLPFEDALNDGQIKIAQKDGQFLFTYADQHYPLNPHAYITMLQTVTEDKPETIHLLIEEAKELQQSDDDKTYNIRFSELKQQLKSLYQQPPAKKYLKSCVEQVNSQPALLQQLSDEQYYQLCYWQETEKQINYRRFFTVNGLICLNMQNPAVFDKCHELVKTLLDKDIIQGLRLDHIDGLYDPTVYLERLRKLTGNETYIVVEKILEDGESFPENWPVQGNTGYDFLAVVNNLFTQADSKKQFADFYRNFNADKSSITQSILNKKSLILYEHMAGELENLYQLFYDLELTDNIYVKPGQIKTVIAEFLIRCPVYRYYGNSFPLPQTEQKAIKYIFKGIREARPELKKTVALFEDIFFKNDPSSDYAQKVLNFYLRWMQFTGPLMAKGVEDTLMYTYDRFIGHNEVGDTPLTFGLPANEFHNYMVARQQQWPLSINATATHDTKRGEGVRARLNVLTDIADDWLNMVMHWQKVNSKYKTNEVPDANDEYLIYQSIAGSYPMPGEDGDGFHTRMEEYLIKGLREAKLHTQWAEPNELYEASCKKFVDAIIQPESAFMKSFQQLQIKIADYGIINSLAQTVLKFTCPGVPDVYQGCEFWDLSMVDPDNRRPVDYEARAHSLQELMASKTSIDRLWANRYNSSIKLWLTQLLLNERKNDTETFKNGIYIPLKVNGKYKDNVLAYARQNDNNWYIIAIPLHLGQINADSNHPGNIDWGNTQIILPEDAPIKWDNLFSGKSSAHTDHINVDSIFKAFPLALLKCT